MYALSAPRCDATAARGLGSSRSAGLRVAARAPVPFTTLPARRLTVVRAAADDDDADFEARLAALKRAKGETPYGEGKKAAREGEKKAAAPSSSKKRQYDFSGETVVFESAPHRGDLAVNVALGITLIWLPLSIAAVGRGLFVKYRFTDRRISCITAAPWQNEQLDAAYEEVKAVTSIGRGVGAWGDMVVTLNDGSKIEMRSLPRFKEMEAYILQRRDELTGRNRGAPSGGSSAAEPAAAAPKGFS
ncbi:hypothetical protein COHA_006427 [Chlorella ohadii]|uniref:YdbS-like PH domain-containing protein n=1 Tax=Chlorella ohadii TaxID=2649997 RepID=A0AAD5H584_9CHLO|nr:hypothetical protein COHA_006427 [Chlorella ohadii]